MDRRTKIVATIGPASDSPEALRSLIDAGMDVARLALAHGTAAEHLDRLRRVRAAAGARGKVLGILADLPGPKVRTGSFEMDGVLLLEGAQVSLVPGDGPSGPERISVGYPSLLEDLRPGDGVGLGDGAVRLRVRQVGAEGLRAEVEHGGRLQGRPGVHLPSQRVALSTPTAADVSLMKMAVEAGFDMVALSFVKSASDVHQLREAAGSDPPMLVAKVETPAAVEHLDEIIDAADAVMVARGDLGVECAIEDIPHLQKRIIRTCVAWGRPVITATQMLESMVYSPAPTRAEASDIANAVLDGADALMLSGETAIGQDPPKAVRTMARIAVRAEREADYVQWGGRLGKLQRLHETPLPVRVSAAISHAAWQAALSVEAAAILCCTRSGSTARVMARFRPTAPLIGLSPNARTARQLTLTWGVLPVTVPEHASTDDMIWLSVERASQLGLVQKGDVVAVLAGNLADPEPVTDQLRLVRVR